MHENAKGNRGSKSEFNSVKEQRIDGKGIESASLRFFDSIQRYILMDIEIYYQNRVLSKGFKNKFFLTPMAFILYFNLFIGLIRLK